jgi:hypothetical protein
VAAKKGVLAATKAALAPQYSEFGGFAAMVRLPGQQIQADFLQIP